jgi:hypothetical protein
MHAGKRKSDPLFSAIAAVTLDGQIAKHSRHLTDWTSPENKAAVLREGLLSIENC